MRSTCFIVALLLSVALSLPTASVWADAPLEVQGGLIVRLGDVDGDRLAALRDGPALLVHGLTRDSAQVAAARAVLLKRGVQGPVSVHLFAGERLPYAENMVNLLLADSEDVVGRAEILRVLVPGGVARIGGETIVKPVPDTIDEWTHWLHGSDGNAVARDQVVGPPRRIQWTARPAWARLHDAPSSTLAMVSTAGRVFYLSDEGPAGMYAGLEDRWNLVARDAYNGVLLWKRPLPEFGWQQWTANWHARNNQPFQMPKRLVAVGDEVYVTLGYHAPVTAMDAATGEILRTYAGTEETDEILVHDGRLILSVNQTEHDPRRTGQAPIEKAVAVVEVASGRILWKSGNFTGLAAKTDSMAPNGRLEMAVGGGRIYLSDAREIVGLDLETGDELWRTERRLGPQLNANFNTQMFQLSVLVYSDGVVLYAQPEGMTSFHTVPGTLYAYDARDGHLLWKRRYGGWVHNTQPNVFVIRGTVWVHEHLEGDVQQGHRMVFPQELHDQAEYAVLGLDLKSGETMVRHITRDIFHIGHHHRCYRNKATERFLLTSRRGVEFVDTLSGENDINYWTRGDCHLGIMPANGLLYTTPHPCDCYIDSKLNGFFALAPAAETRPVAAGPDFVEGPAYGLASEPVDDCAEDWPTFRADARRRGFVPTKVDGALVPAWTAELGGTCGPVSVAGGKVFVPVIDQHRVTALDAEDGTPIWDFLADARVDTPPTVYHNLALFGSADGWVYCLDAKDGRLVWKRRLAPRERLIGARGQLESAWPVHGSVLIQNDVAYVAAGRSSFLDGGIHLVSLDPRTGEVLDRRTEYTPDPETDKMQPDPSWDHAAPGMLPDVLVGDHAAVWMRSDAVFGEPSGGPHVVATGGMRDDAWFNRTTWQVGATPHAQLLVFGDARTYAIESFTSLSRAKAFEAGAAGYRLFARLLDARAVSSTVARRGGAKKADAKDLWSERIPVRATAMALAQHSLLLAGSPDVVDPLDPLAALEGRKGSVLRVVATADGTMRSEIELDALPVWDGMAVARGNVYLAMQDGSVRCFVAR